MAVDHGLGGKDNQKSKDKRARRAQKQKVFARSALTGGKKKEVVFDENARVEWLTGFRKRKEERRKFGLTKRVEKEKKEIKGARKGRRAIVAEAAADEANKAIKARGGRVPKPTDVVEPEEVSVPVVAEKKVLVYDDSFTTGFFGGHVSIAVQEGISFDD